jgi:miniconductance mechanosensitive channel
MSRVFIYNGEMQEDLLDLLRRLFRDATTVGPGVAILISLGLAAGSYLLARYVILGIILRWLGPKKNKWLNTIIEARIPHLLTLLVPPIVIYAILPYYSLEAFNPAIETLSRLLTIYVVLVITLVLNGVLLAVDGYYNRLDYSKTFPITSILQVVRAILYVLFAVVIISILFDIPSIYILAAIGAVIASLTVVSNNLIMAFVAGLILTSKRLVMIGDWIEIPELRINGEVVEITMTTAIVRNLDHTIGTVPSTYLLSNSFKNWRGVREEGARKMFWPVYFDVNSIKPVDQELLDRIAGLPYGVEILPSQANSGDLGNSRHFLPVESSGSTNLGLFREYFTRYLQNHPLMVAQKLLSVYFEAPTTFGLPMQVLVSTHETGYERFLEIQSGLLEDILQLAGEFDLKVYQLEERLAGRLLSDVES